MRQGILFIILFWDQCFSQIPPDPPQIPNANPEMETDDQLYRQLSPGAFFGMKENEDEEGMGLDMNGTNPVIGPDNMPGGEGKRGYEHFDLATIDALSRTAQATVVANSAHIYTIDNKTQANQDMLTIYNLCFCISYIWRRGRLSIRKYFHMRDIYAHHLGFEVGYLTHVIMERYQNMLELYEYSAAQVSPAPKKKKGDKTTPVNKPTINRQVLSHFFYSIQKDLRTVQHMCNMLHELKAKYAVRKYHPENKFEIPPATPNGTTEQVATEASAEESQESDEDDRLVREGKIPKVPKLDKGYLAKKIEQSHKLIDAALAQRKKKLKDAREFFSKHGYHSTTTRTQQKMRLWSPNLDYGWSGEEDW